MVVHIAVFGARCKAESIRREVNCVHGTEVTCNLSQFLLVDYAEQLDFKSASLDILQGYITRLLATADGDVEFLVVAVVKERTDCCASARLFPVLEISHFFQCL